MLVYHEDRLIDTKGKNYTNITTIVRDVLHAGGAGNGMVHVFVEHTTACVKILENELLSLADIEEHLNDLAPIDDPYLHDMIGLRDVPQDERVNGYAHVRSLYFNHSETLPVQSGRLQLGLWQTLFLIDLDGPRDRRIHITFMGTAKETT